MPASVKTDLGFADLYCRKSDVVRISNLAKKAYSFNRKFFGRGIKRKFGVVICYSRKEFDAIWGAKTDKWLTGFATKTGTIVSFKDDLIRKYNPRKDVTLLGTLKHEVNHLFYRELYGTYEPAWLLEGITLQYPFEPFELMENDRKRLNGPLPHLIYSTRDKTFFKKAPYLYPMAFLATRHLIEEHGMAKVLKTLALYAKDPTKTGFEAAFQKTFGYSTKELEVRVFAK